MQERKKRMYSIMKLAIIAALYVTLTYALSFLSYNEIQFRVAEILMLLCFFKLFEDNLLTSCDILDGLKEYATQCKNFLVLTKMKYLKDLTNFLHIGIQEEVNLSLEASKAV